MIYSENDLSDHNASENLSNQGEILNNDENDDDFGDFESISHTNNPITTTNDTSNSSSDSSHFSTIPMNISLDDIHSDDPFIQKFALESRQMFVRFLPPDIESYKQVNPGCHELSQSKVDEYLAMLKESVPNYTREEKEQQLQKLKSHIVKVEGTKTILDSFSLPSICLENDAFDMYDRFSKKPLDISSSSRPEEKSMNLK